MLHRRILLIRAYKCRYPGGVHSRTMSLSSQSQQELKKLRWGLIDSSYNTKIYPRAGMGLEVNLSSYLAHDIYLSYAKVEVSKQIFRGRLTILYN